MADPVPYYLTLLRDIIVNIVTMIPFAIMFWKQLGKWSATRTEQEVKLLQAVCIKEERYTRLEERLKSHEHETAGSFLKIETALDKLNDNIKSALMVMARKGQGS